MLTAKATYRRKMTGQIVAVLLILIVACFSGALVKADIAWADNARNQTVKAAEDNKQAQQSQQVANLAPAVSEAATQPSSEQSIRGSVQLEPVEVSQAPVQKGALDLATNDSNDAVVDTLSSNEPLERQQNATEATLPQVPQESVDLPGGENSALNTVDCNADAVTNSKEESSAGQMTRNSAKVDQVPQGSAVETPSSAQPTGSSQRANGQVQVNVASISEGESVAEPASILPASTQTQMLAPNSSNFDVVEGEGLYPHERNAVLVWVAPGISRAAFDSIIHETGSFDTASVTDEDLLNGLVKLYIADNSSIADAIARLNAQPAFSSAQPNYVYKVSDIDISASVSDRYANSQWSLEKVGAFAAWDQVKVNNSVAVAVIDTGADLDHPDLEANIVATYNAVSSSNTVEDQLGHGSHVAGIIAGVANNAKGVAGVSYNANLVIIKASDYKSTNFDTASIIRAYTWLESLDSSGMTVAEHYNVKVVNLSIGGRDDVLAANHPDDALVQAIRKARDEYGLLTVCAAGNGGASSVPYSLYPGDSSACLTVMNLAQSDDPTMPYGVVLNETSNYNVEGTNYKNICAPGSKIYSTWINGGYASSTGTSMAAPLVSGIAALMYAVNPTLTPLQVTGILQATATDLGEEGWDERYGYGMVNAEAAVRMANATRIDGWKAVGIGGTAGYSAVLAAGLQNVSDAWTWSVLPGEGNARIDSNGVIIGLAAGDVTILATCTVASGAQVSGLMTVNIVDAEIQGPAELQVGTKATYVTNDPRWTWVWKVENGTGAGLIDQDGVLTATRAGNLVVTATCTSNTEIVFYFPATVTAVFEQDNSLLPQVIETAAANDEMQHPEAFVQAAFVNDAADAQEDAVEEGASLLPVVEAAASDIELRYSTVLVKAASDNAYGDTRKDISNAHEPFSGDSGTESVSTLRIAASETADNMNDTPHEKRLVTIAVHKTHAVDERAASDVEQMDSFARESHPWYGYATHTGSTNAVKSILSTDRAHVGGITLNDVTHFTAGNSLSSGINYLVKLMHSIKYELHGDNVYRYNYMAPGVLAGLKAIINRMLLGWVSPAFLGF